MDLDVEYRYERFAAITLSQWFAEKDYEVHLSVPGPVEELAHRDNLGGIEPPELTSMDFSDPQRRYEIYFDSPGHIDFVARNDEEVWLIEAKGLIKGWGVPGTVTYAIGQVVIMMKPELDYLRYGILLPREERFAQVVVEISPTNPVLSREDFSIFWVSREGSIKVERIGATQSND